MTRTLALFASVIVATTLALPTTAQAQATRRGGSSSGTSSGGSSGGSSSGGGGSVAVPRQAAPRQSAPSPRERSAGVSGTSGPSRPAAVRPASGRLSSESRTPSTSTDGGFRLRNSQAVRGVAQPRGSVAGRPQSDLFSPWGRWSPWYNYGFGYSPSSYYGHVVYSPWLYGGSVWSWNRYGWHDPFLFDPFGYGGYAPYYWSPSADRNDEREAGVATGSLRLRVDPGHARVYVDGALAGVASEFGGFSNHLELPAGVHQIEFRAEGYATVSLEVDVRENRTRTERVNLEED